MLMQQHRTRIRSLKTQWTNPMASSIRFDSHLHTALLIASKVAVATGMQPPALTETPLIWLEPRTTGRPHHVICDDIDNETEDTPTELYPLEADDGIDDVATLFGDFVVEDNESATASQPPLSAPAIQLIWELPVR